MNRDNLDDLTLIRLFITGQGNLTTNGKLRVQSALDTHQLLARNGEILASSCMSNDPPEVQIRPHSPYTQPLHKTLLAHEFLPIGTSSTTGFARYEYHAVPEKYQLCCLSARTLWQQWWMRKRQRQNRADSINMDLLVFTQKAWYPIRDIAFSNSTLFIKTYRGETGHQAEDLVVWAEAQPETQEEPTQFMTAQQIEARASNSRKPEHAAPCLSHPPTVKKTPSAPSPLPQVGDLPQYWRRVVRREDGKIYVKTTLGVLMIEGADLSCQLHQRYTNMALTESFLQQAEAV
ncbi:MAG: hypothetical protein AAGH78_04580 [Cyanobacteria bacterium P01_H01_bin.58]